MNKLIPYTIIAWLLSLIFVFYYAYNKGVEATQAKMQNAVTKPIDSNIKSSNDNIGLVESLNDHNLKNLPKLLYPEPITIIKYVKERQVCEDGKIAQNAIDVINGVIR